MKREAPGIHLLGSWMQSAVANTESLSRSGLRRFHFPVDFLPRLRLIEIDPRSVILPSATVELGRNRRQAILDAGVGREPTSSYLRCRAAGVWQLEEQVANRRRVSSPYRSELDSRKAAAAGKTAQQRVAGPVVDGLCIAGLLRPGELSEALLVDDEADVPRAGEIDRLCCDVGHDLLHRLISAEWHLNSMKTVAEDTDLL